jgi:glycosyltransferase involved in cell wall biosynthesis
MSSLTSVPPTIVSITPLAVRSDSRTLKQASSVARLGYRSIVVEGRASRLDRSRLLFELLSVPAPPRGCAQTKASLPTKRKALRTKRKALRHYRKLWRSALDDIRAQIDQRFAVCSYMESDIGDAFEQLAGEPRLAEFVAGVAEARAAVLALKTRIQPWRLETAADWRVLEIAACGTRNDSATFTDDNLRHAYRELDALLAQEVALLSIWRDLKGALPAPEIAEGFRIARLRKLFTRRGAAVAFRLATQLPGRLARRLDAAPVHDASVPVAGAALDATAPRRDRGLRDAGRVAARAVGYLQGPVKLYRRWQESEPSMFWRHLKSYVGLHVLAPLRVTPKASLYYMHSFYQFPAIYLLCLRYRAKFIYDVHDFYSSMQDDAALSHFWSCWVVPMEFAIERICMRKAAAVVTVNQSIATLIEQRFGRSAIVLRNAHDPRLEQPVERTIKDVLGLGADDFLVVCLGQFKPGMAIEAAIAAMASVPRRCHLAFLGAGFPDFGVLLERHDVVGQVHFVPPAAPDEVVPFIRSADAGMLVYTPVSASIERSLPNGFFQPLAAGLPMIYPNLPEISRVAEAHRIGLPIDPRDSVAIATAIARLAADDGLARDMRLNVEAAKAELSWENDELRLSRLIAKFVGAGAVRLDEPSVAQLVTAQTSGVTQANVGGGTAGNDTGVDNGTDLGGSTAAGRSLTGAYRRF